MVSSDKMHSVVCDCVCLHAQEDSLLVSLLDPFCMESNGSFVPSEGNLSVTHKRFYVCNKHSERMK